jgi:hypothetical protein
MYCLRIALLGAPCIGDRPCRLPKRSREKELKAAAAMAQCWTAAAQSERRSDHARVVPLHKRRQQTKPRRRKVVVRER